jgi:hypothetical protein
MKLCFVGPGIMSIPPKGWGAVEILIWDLKQILEFNGATVSIVNTRNRNKIIQEVNQNQPDFIHVMYDEFIDIVDKFNCKSVTITSHYGYLEQPNKYNGYQNIFKSFINSNVNIFALSEGIKNIYLRAGADPSKVYVVPNGVRNDLFKFAEDCLYKDRSIYLAKVDYRKRQKIFQNIPNLYFAGTIADNEFKSQNYIGEWNKEFLYNNLTSYANLVLLSDGEAHPLVCLEAMTAGLGLVISEYATANLDLSKQFIDVISENMISNLDYVEKVINTNRKKSLSMRNEIRKYAIESFSYDAILEKYYIPSMRKII